MDKKIIDTLVKFGLITNIDVDANKYESVDDLISKGVVTIPGAKEKIVELLEGLELVEETVNAINATVIEPAIDNPVITEVHDDPAPVIDETPETEQPIVDTPEDITPLDETPETDVELIVNDDPAEVEVTITEVVEEQTEVVTDTPKKSKKSTKKNA